MRISRFSVRQHEKFVGAFHLKEKQEGTVVPEQLERTRGCGTEETLRDG